MKNSRQSLPHSPINFEEGEKSESGPEGGKEREKDVSKIIENIASSSELITFNSLPKFKGEAVPDK